jgi:hypothetical protein
VIIPDPPEEIMKNKAGLRKFSIVLLLVMLVSLFGGAAYARAEVATVDVFRIDRTFILLKITFPNDISGSFAGEMAGKHFDCLTIPPNILICIGRFRVGPDPAFLTIYDQDTDEIILQKVIKSPPGNGKGEGEEQPAAPTPPPPPSDDTSDDSGPG